MASVKKHPTKAQFDVIQGDLSRIHAAQYFRIDGYLILATTIQVKMSVKITVYVNGWQRGSWLWQGRERDHKQMPDIARKFYCLSKRQLYSAKEIKSWERVYGSKATARKNGLYDKYWLTYPCFNTAGAFIAHIKKHNDSIEMLTAEAYRAAIALLPTEGEHDEEAA